MWKGIFILLWTIWLFWQNLYNRSVIAAVFLLFTFAGLILVPIGVRTGRKHLSVVMSRPVSVLKEERLPGSITFVNRRRCFSVHLRGQIRFINHLTGEHQEYDFTISVPEKGQRELCWQFRSSYCGRATVELAMLRIEDVLSFFSVPVGQELQEEFWILPHGWQSEEQKESVLSELPDWESMLFSAQKKGSDTSEVTDIRQWTPEYPLKNIHWKLSEKMNTLLVREYGYPISDKLLLLVDNRQLQEIPSEQCWQWRDQFAGKACALLCFLQEQSSSCSLGLWQDKELVLFESDAQEGLQEGIRRLLSMAFCREKEDALSYLISHYAEERRRYSRIYYLTEHMEIMEV